MDDHVVVRNISDLVAEEHELREHAESGAGLSDVDRQRMEQLEIQLDRCWDLLRRRQAREELGQDPDLETTRPASVVEHYQQ